MIYALERRALGAKAVAERERAWRELCKTKTLHGDKVKASMGIYQTDYRLLNNVNTVYVRHLYYVGV